MQIRGGGAFAGGGTKSGFSIVHIKTGPNKRGGYIFPKSFRTGGGPFLFGTSEYISGSYKMTGHFLYWFINIFQVLSQNSLVI